MTRKLKTLFVAAAALGGGASAAFAEGNTSSVQSPPAMRGAMGDHDSLMHMMGMMSPDHMTRMSRMIDNCNRMMESAGNSPTGPGRTTCPARSSEHSSTAEAFISGYAPGRTAVEQWQLI